METCEIIRSFGENVKFDDEEIENFLKNLNKNDKKIVLKFLKIKPENYAFRIALLKNNVNLAGKIFVKAVEKNKNTKVLDFCEDMRGNIINILFQKSNGKEAIMYLVKKFGLVDGFLNFKNYVSDDNIFHLLGRSVYRSDFEICSAILRKFWDMKVVKLMLMEKNINGEFPLDCFIFERGNKVYNTLKYILMCNKDIKFNDLR